MADPLSYKSKGITHRTPRDRARAHGTKVPPLPSAAGYCPTHGMAHEGGVCKTGSDPAEPASKGGSAKLPKQRAPFKF